MGSGGSLQAGEEGTGLTSRLDLAHVVREIAGAVRDNWRALLIYGLIVFVPVSLITTILPFDDLDADGLDDRRAIAALALGTAAGLVSMIGTVLYAGVISGAVHARREGSRPPFGETARSLPYGKLLLSDVALILIVGAGFVLLLVPGFVFLVWFALVAPAVEIEHRTVRSGLARSRELIRGNFWRAALFVWPAFVLQATLEEAGEDAAHELLGEGWISEWLGTTAGSMLAGPTFALVVVVLFLELREPRAR